MPPLRAVAADLHKREQQHLERLVSFPPKAACGKKTAESCRDNRVCGPAAGRPFNDSS